MALRTSYYGLALAILAACALLSSPSHVHAVQPGRGLLQDTPAAAPMAPFPTEATPPLVANSAGLPAPDPSLVLTQAELDAANHTRLSSSDFNNVNPALVGSPNLSWPLNFIAACKAGSMSGAAKATYDQYNKWVNAPSKDKKTVAGQTINGLVDNTEYIEAGLKSAIAAKKLTQGGANAIIQDAVNTINGVGAPEGFAVKWGEMVQVAILE